MFINYSKVSVGLISLERLLLI